MTWSNHESVLTEQRLLKGKTYVKKVEPIAAGEEISRTERLKLRLIKGRVGHRGTIKHVDSESTVSCLVTMAKTRGLCSEEMRKKPVKKKAGTCLDIEEGHKLRLERTQVIRLCGRFEVVHGKAQLRKPLPDERPRKGVEVALINEILEDGDADAGRRLSENLLERAQCAKTAELDQTAGWDRNGRYGGGKEGSQGELVSLAALEVGGLDIEEAL